MHEIGAAKCYNACSLISCLIVGSLD